MKNIKLYFLTTSARAVRIPPNPKGVGDFFCQKDLSGFEKSSLWGGSKIEILTPKVRGVVAKKCSDGRECYALQIFLEQKKR